MTVFLKKWVYIKTVIDMATVMPQRCVIQRSNGNFAGFPVIVLKIAKNYPMKHNLHFSGKWQNRQISQFPRYW